tara:strand:+ start:2268 stop:2462 length:195 start_codon:yes stop_codon:yes gene_type:complete
MVITYQTLIKPEHKYAESVDYFPQRVFHSYQEAQDHIHSELEEWETDCVFIYQNLWICPPDCPF